MRIRASRRYRTGREEEANAQVVARFDAFYETVRPSDLAPDHNFTAWRLRDDHLPGAPILDVVAVEFPERAGNSIMRIYVVGRTRSA